MAHILHDLYRREFLGTAECVRIILADVGRESPRAGILVKSNTLALKYALREERLSLTVFPTPWGGVGYVVRLGDHEGLMLWSLVETAEELRSVAQSMTSPQVDCFLFDEIASNLASCELTPTWRSTGELDAILDAELIPYDDDLYSAAAGLVMSREWVGLNSVTRDFVVTNSWNTVVKARNQLGGALRSIRRGLVVVDEYGNPVELARRAIPHVLVLVPDLHLLSDSAAINGEFLRDASAEVDGIFQILDPTELLHTVQAAQMMSGESDDVFATLAAMDWYLIERAERALGIGSPTFRMLFRRQ